MAASRFGSGWSFGAVLGRVVVTEAMHANGAAFHLSCETQAVNCPIDMRPIKILGDGHLPPECSIVLHSSWAVIVFVALTDIYTFTNAFKATKYSDFLEGGNEHSGPSTWGSCGWVGSRRLSVRSGHDWVSRGRQLSAQVSGSWVGSRRLSA